MTTWGCAQTRCSVRACVALAGGTRGVWKTTHALKSPRLSLLSLDTLTHKTTLMRNNKCS